MATDFTPITTQDDFDKAIQSRLQREREKFKDYDALKDKAEKYDVLVGKNYEQTIADLQEQLGDANGKLTAATARAEKAENSLLKHQIAQEYKIPYELAGRLSGTNEKELRADAESLSKFVTHKQTAPLASTEPANVNSTDAAFSALLNDLKGD